MGKAWNENYEKMKKKRPEFVDGSDMNFGGVRNCEQGVESNTPYGGYHARY